MNKKFIERLEEFLRSELNDYGFNYDWEWGNDGEYITVNIKQDYTGKEIDLEFIYNEEKDVLSISMYEDNYEEVVEYSRSVKYFWIKISPVFFD